MLSIAYFTDNGVPKTGLSPIINIRDASTGALVVTAGAMIEIGDGFYKYDFVGYDISKDYTMLADGGAVLSDTERYVPATNGTDSSIPGVWDLAIADHLSVGSTGEKLNDIGTPTDVAEAVWDEVVTGHVVPNSFAIELYGKAEQSTVVLLADVVELIRQFAFGGWHMTGNQLIFYDDVLPTPNEIARFNLFNSAGNPALENVVRRIPLP